MSNSKSDAASAVAHYSSLISHHSSLNPPTRSREAAKQHKATLTGRTGGTRRLVGAHDACPFYPYLPTGAWYSARGHGDPLAAHGAGGRRRPRGAAGCPPG